MTRFLLDVNVLIALIDPAQVMHDKAHQWFENSGSEAWATCPLTQNGVLRVVGHSKYPNSPGTPAAVASTLALFLADPQHEFWSDSIALMDCPVIRPARLLDSAQVTDTYLLALAAIREGKLATFDQKLVTTAVKHGDQFLHVIR